MITIDNKTPLSALIAQSMTIPQIVEYRATEQLNRIDQLKKIAGWKLTLAQAKIALDHYDYIKAKPFRKIPDSEFIYQALRIVS